MKTRCKFRVEHVIKYNGPWENIKLTAVCGGSGESAENQSFAAATPNGNLEITVSNPAVLGTFIPGKEYYLDLIPVE